MTAGRIGLLVAAVLAWHVPAPAVQTTRVLGVVANYADTASFRAGTEALRKILSRVSDFYAEGSGGGHALVADVHPSVLVLPQARPAGKCRFPDRDRLSAALREARIDLSGYRALVLVVPPSTQGCPGGVQTGFRHRETTGRVRNVPLAVSWSLTERYVAHEVLHTHGLGHAKSLQCRGATLAPGCRTREYGNAWDLMGHDGASFQMISAPLRAALGWTEVRVHESGSATYTIGAATRPAGLPTAVQVRLPFAGHDAMALRQPLALWIEYRAAFGFDQRMGRFENFAAGAMVHLTGSWQRVGGTQPQPVECPQRSPCLLDMTPQTAAWRDAGLAVGRSWTEPFSGTRIDVLSRTDTTLTVRVSMP